MRFDDNFEPEIIWPARDGVEQHTCASGSWLLADGSRLEIHPYVEQQTGNVRIVAKRTQLPP